MTGSSVSRLKLAYLTCGKLVSTGFIRRGRFLSSLRRSRCSISTSASRSLFSLIV